MLVRRPITASGYSGVKPMVPDLMELDVEAMHQQALTPRLAPTPMSPSKMWASPALNASQAVNQSFAFLLDQDLKVQYCPIQKLGQISRISFRLSSTATYEFKKQTNITSFLLDYHN